MRPYRYAFLVTLFMSALLGPTTADLLANDATALAVMERRHGIIKAFLGIFNVGAQRFHYALQYPGPSPSTSPSVSPSMSHTCSSTPTPTVSETSSRSVSPSMSHTCSSTPSPSGTSSPSSSSTVTVSPTNSVTPSSSHTCSPSVTSTPSSTTSGGYVVPSESPTPTPIPPQGSPSVTPTPGSASASPTPGSASASPNPGSASSSPTPASASASSSPVSASASSSPVSASASPTATSVSASPSTLVGSATPSTSALSVTPSASSGQTPTASVTSGLTPTASPTNNGPPSASPSPASDSASVTSGLTPTASVTSGLTPTQTPSSSPGIGISTSPIPGDVSPSPVPGDIYTVVCTPPDQTRNWNLTATVNCTLAVGLFDCNNLVWFHVIWDPVPVPAGQSRFDPFDFANEIAGTKQCVDGGTTVTFLPTTGMWTVMSRYQITVVLNETRDEFGRVFANAPVQVFYTAPTGGDFIEEPLVPAGTPSPNYLSGANLWKWLGPLLAVLLLLLLLLLLCCCCRKRRGEAAAMSKSSTEMSSAASSSVAASDSAPPVAASDARIHSYKSNRPPPDFAIYGQKHPPRHLTRDAENGSVAAMATLRAWEAANEGGRGEGVEWEDVYDWSGQHASEGVVVDVERRGSANGLSDTYSGATYSQTYSQTNSQTPYSDSRSITRTESV